MLERVVNHFVIDDDAVDLGWIPGKGPVPAGSLRLTGSFAGAGSPRKQLMIAMRATRSSAGAETRTAGTWFQQTFYFIGNRTANELSDRRVVGERSSPEIENSRASAPRAVRIKRLIEAVVYRVPMERLPAVLALSLVLLARHRLTPLTYPKREWIF